MAEILDVSRSEVQRWLDAGTLGVCETVTGLDKDYYLVACTAYEKDWSSWTPSVGRTIDTESDAEYWSNLMPDEMVDEVYGHVFCNCFEVWHVVDDYDDDFDDDCWFDQQLVGNEVLSTIDLSRADQICHDKELLDFFDIESDLEDLRFAGVADRFTSSVKDFSDSYAVQVSL